MTAVAPPGLLDRAATAAAHACDLVATPPAPTSGSDLGPASPRWWNQSLSKGAAGIAVLHGIRARQGLADPARTHQWLARAVREELSAAASAGLWFGAPAVAYAIDTAAPGRYRRAMVHLDAAVARLTQARLAAAHARIAAGRLPTLSEFDLVRGLTGLGAYLLQRHPDGELVRHVLSYLVRLTEPLPPHDTAGSGLPGWWSADPPAGASVDRFPGGHGNLGMAHGIAGPLALLATAMRRGITVADQDVAVARISDWLTAWRQPGPAGPWWPEYIGMAELRARHPDQKGPARPSWCYGTPGLSRALRLAAIARNDRPGQRAAEHALACCLADPTQLARLVDPSMCHGWAGVTAIAHTAAADATTALIHPHLPRLTETCIDQTNRLATTPPGLIDGIAGLALTLHTIAAENPAPEGFRWAACLLMA